jgi:uncharacterized protein
VIAPQLARRLAIVRQRLAGPQPTADPAGVLGLVRELGCLQLDPISVVARSDRLVLFSRLGAYDPEALETLLWKDRALFEYWAHAASIVLTEDFPIHRAMMQSYLHGKGSWPRRVREWMAENAPLERHVLEELERNGPLPARRFEDRSAKSWESTGWNTGRNIGRMLDFLWIQGRILVAGRSGQNKLWDLAERCLPQWTPREDLGERERVRRAAQKSLRALGVARVRQIQQHYVRGRYPGLESVLQELVAEGLVVPAEIRGPDGPWPGPWYLHAEDLPLVEALERGEWDGRTTLLSPFDNLLCDRSRTEQLFGFEFRLEIYVPKAKRRYGYYVLPILHGDRLIGRIDAAMDRRASRLDVHAVHAEPGAPATKGPAEAVAGAVEALGSWLGAREIAYGRILGPPAWKRALA